MPTDMKLTLHIAIDMLAITTHVAVGFTGVDAMDIDTRKRLLSLSRNVNLATAAAMLS